MLSFLTHRILHCNKVETSFLLLSLPLRTQTQVYFAINWKYVPGVSGSHRKCSIKGLFLKIYSQENTCADVSFINKRPQQRWFPVNIAKFLRTTILKNICIYFWGVIDTQEHNIRNKKCHHLSTGINCKIFKIYSSCRKIFWRDE